MNPLLEKKLSYQAKKRLPRTSFAIPGKQDGVKGKYPIQDISHARNALSRVSAHGTPEEKKKVRAAVHRRYPSIGKDTHESILANRLVDQLLG
jgi:hypothetical protein